MYLDDLDELWKAIYIFVEKAICWYRGHKIIKEKRPCATMQV